MSTSDGREGARPSLLDALEPAARDALLTAARLRRFRAGDIVFHEGDAARDLHVVETGHFSLHVNLPTGEEVMLGVLGAGEVFGEMALLVADGTRAATVRAVEASTTRTIERTTFGTVLSESPALASALFALLAAKIRRADERLVEALYVPAETRVVRRLLEVAAHYPGSEDGSIEVPLRQEDLAALAGTSRGTVNRVLRAQASRGTVALSRGRTRVLDRDALARTSG